MKLDSKIILLICSITTWCACNSGSLEPVEYVQWIADLENGLLVTENSAGYTFQLQYQPAELLVLNELRKETITQQELDSKLKDKQGLEYYVLKIFNDNESKRFRELTKQSDSALYYVNYGIIKDFYLVSSDTMYCKIAHYESSNGLTPYDAFTLGFERSLDTINDKKFMFNAHFLNSNWVDLTISREAINSIPKIKTE